MEKLIPNVFFNEVMSYLTSKVSVKYLSTDVDHTIFNIQTTQTP